MTIHYCPSCQYIGTKAGWWVQDEPRQEPYPTCINDCKIDDGSSRDGQYVKLATLEDGEFPGLSEADNVKAMAALSKYQAAQMSPLGREAFDLGAMMMGAV